LPRPARRQSRRSPAGRHHSHPREFARFGRLVNFTLIQPSALSERVGPIWVRSSACKQIAPGRPDWARCLYRADDESAPFFAGPPLIGSERSTQGARPPLPPRPRSRMSNPAGIDIRVIARFPRPFAGIAYCAADAIGKTKLRYFLASRDVGGLGVTAEPASSLHIGVTVTHLGDSRGRGAVQAVSRSGPFRCYPSSPLSRLVWLSSVLPSANDGVVPTHARYIRERTRYNQTKPGFVGVSVLHMVPIVGYVLTKFNVTRFRR